MGRGDLTNAEWERLVPLLPEGGQRGGRWSDRRLTINGVLYRARSGLPWRDLPERFGPWITVYKRIGAGGTVASTGVVYEFDLVTSVAAVK